jgi:hypothetical protein
VDVLRHDDEGVQLKSPLPSIAVECLEKEPCVRFDNKELSALPR